MQHKDEAISPAVDDYQKYASMRDEKKTPAFLAQYWPVRMVNLFEQRYQQEINGE